MPVRRTETTSTIREEAMARMGPLFPRMHTDAFGDEVANGKPAPDIYLLAAQRLGIPAERCLALEDSLPGIEAAERAGLRVIVVPDLVPSHDGVRYVCGPRSACATGWRREGWGLFRRAAPGDPGAMAIELEMRDRCGV
jgi:beta-phosphoglucomutase-like phosphatase (HAD superfamily)